MKTGLGKINEVALSWMGVIRLLHKVFRRKRLSNNIKIDFNIKNISIFREINIAFPRQQQKQYLLPITDGKKSRLKN